MTSGPIPSLVLAGALLFQAGSAAGQGASGVTGTAAQMLPGDVAKAASQAAETLTSAGVDKILIKDMLGATITGPGGQTIGTVENLVVVPGGRVVAAIVATKDQSAGRIPVPFPVLKLSTTADKLGISLPMSLSDLKSMPEVQSLAKALPDVKP